MKLRHFCAEFPFYFKTAWSWGHIIKMKCRFLPHCDINYILDKNIFPSVPHLGIKIAFAWEMIEVLATKVWFLYRVQESEVKGYLNCTLLQGNVGWDPQLEILGNVLWTFYSPIVKCQFIETVGNSSRTTFSSLKKMFTLFHDLSKYPVSLDFQDQLLDLFYFFAKEWFISLQTPLWWCFG